MKKILIAFVLLFMSISMNAQLNGTGTYIDPWSGTLAGDATWSGTKFINGDITVDNETLTISAGAVIIFLNDEADLIITGTGSFNASGNSGSLITITADDDNDGNYGESGERWGHIFFNAPNESNQSVIDHCIIEFGDVHNYSDSRGYGGAIHSNLSNLIISNCVLRNNYGDWGGGIFVHSSKNPTIRNCHIYNNTSDHSGGGVYCWNSSGSNIENCVFEGNHCLETSVSYYTGGGLAAQTGCSIRVVNCTFVNNSSNQSEGQGLLIHASPDSRIINSIFWGGSEKQIYSYGTTANIFINCGYRGITYSSGTPVNPVVLSSDNSASNGPNFINPSTSNWNLFFISPCCNKGINSYTGVTIPLNDYAGNSRIGIKDIGSYEVQYSYWNGSSNTSWSTSANWDGNVEPSNGTGDVIIPSGLTIYPTSSVNPSFTVATGKQMILNPGAKLTLSSLVNNGSLKLESDGSSISSLITGSYSGNPAIVELNLTGGEAGSRNFRWHYISSPVSTLPVSVFTPATQNIVRYYDSRVSTDMTQGWVAYDGYIYTVPPAGGGPTFSNLLPGIGYDYYDQTDNEFTLNGLLNSSDIAVTLDYAGISETISGFNLLGNPFPSGLDWDYIITHRFPSNTSKGLFFTRNNSVCSYISGVGVPSDVTGFIPPMQGFFTKTYATGRTLYLADSARTHSMHSRYKGSETIPLVRLSLTDDTLSDEAVVRFDEKATPELDYDFDAIKMFYSTDYTSIYTSAGASKLVINGLPFPETSVDIPVGVNLKTDGMHSITNIQLQGLDLFNVFLYDNVTGYSANLKTNPAVSFISSSGLYPDRFILKVSNAATGREDTFFNSQELFNIYQGYGSINIQTISDEWNGKIGSVSLYDLAGKKIADRKNLEFSKNSLIRIPAPVETSLYLIEIKSGTEKFTGKVMIK